MKDDGSLKDFATLLRSASEALIFCCIFSYVPSIKVQYILNVSIGSHKIEYKYIQNIPKAVKSGPIFSMLFSTSFLSPGLYESKEHITSL